MDANRDIRELAEEHVEWLISFLVPLIRRVGTDEFVHGYKHGVQDTRERLSNLSDEEDKQ